MRRQHRGARRRANSPPYVIEAIGNRAQLNLALEQSPEVVTYRDYVEHYQLGLETRNLADIEMNAYAGTVSLTHARALSDDDAA